MKKLLAIFLSVLLLCTAVPFAYATASTEPTIELPNLEAKAGDIIEVPIMLKNNPGIVSAVVEIIYDKDVLELVSYYNEDEEIDMNLIVPGEGFSEKYFSWGDLGVCIVNFCHGSSKNKNYNGEILATATFKVKDDAAAGTYPLVIDYDPANFFNVVDQVNNQVDFGATNGSVTVLADEPETPDEPVYTEPTIVLPNLEAKAGDTIEVPIMLKNNPGIVSAVVEIIYDKDVLELVTYYNEDEEIDMNLIVPGEGFSEKYFSWGDLGVCIVNFCHGSSKNKNYDGEILATATFKVKDDAVSGTYPLVIDYDPANFFNVVDQVNNQVDFAAANGSVTIEGGEAPEIPCEHEYDADCDPDCNLCGEIRDVHTEGIIHFDAVDAGCHYIGNIEYWMCPKCEIFWADEALTQITNSKNVILPALGSENVEHVEAKAPSCNELGNIEYWHCSDCDQYWQDEALTQLTNAKNVLIGVIDHNIVHFDAIAPGCHYVGNIEYWMCTECEIFWQDEALTQITNSKNVIIPALGGEVIAFEAIAPGCHYDGQIAYWFCPECEQYWQDEALTQVTNSKNVILPATGSENLQHVEAKDATCTADGNIEYWYCSDCEQFWQDEALTQLTNSKNVVIGATGHAYDAPCDADCNNCGEIRELGGAGGSADYTMSDYKVDGELGGGEINRDLDEKVNFYISSGWFTTQARIYKNAYGIFTSTDGISSMALNVGGKNSTFDVFTSEDGVTWTLSHDNVAFTTAYSIVTLEFATPVKYVKLDASMAQIRIQDMTINFVGGGNVHNVVYKEAVASTCTEMGNIEYWTCADCGKIWLDEACTQAAELKDVQLSTNCANSAVYTEGVAPGCHYIGRTEYWYCANCDVYYLDAACTQITNYKSLTIPALKDSADYVAAKTPTCTENGNVEYWTCAECEQVWTDEALTQLSNIKNVQIAPSCKYTAVHTDGIEPGCHYTGWTENWYCANCDVYYLDADCTIITNYKSLTIPALQNTAEHVEAKDPTCNEYGNVEYWFCDECEQVWADEALTQVTNIKNVRIDVVDHTIVHFDAVEAGCHYNGNIEYWFCSVCKMFWQDAELTQVTNSKNVIVPATGSDKLQHVEAKEPTATENGNIEYWYCPECEQFWQDEALTQITNVKNVIIPATGEVEEPDSPVTGDSSVAVVVALLTLIASGVAVVLLKNKKRA